MFVLRGNRGIEAIAPLVLMKRFGMVHFEILGARDLFEPAGFLHRDSTSFDLIVKAILDYNKPLLLQRFPPEPVPESLKGGGLWVSSRLTIVHENTSPWIPITVPWQQYEMKMKSKIRSGLRRIRRRLEEQGDVCVELHTSESGEFGRALEEGFRIEASGWKKKSGTAILENKRLKDFFLTYVRIVSHLGLPRIFLLTLKGKGVAMMLGVEHAGRLWILKVGYDEAWSSFAPGILLHHEAIRWAFENGLKGFEFLGSAEPFIQSRWLPDLHRYRTFRVAPKSIIGGLWLATEAVRVAVKRTNDYLLKLRT
jgi:CelD/BcsL family acetyltransferase involved in cellulose biosynthesis